MAAKDLVEYVAKSLVDDPDAAPSHSGGGQLGALVPPDGRSRIDLCSNSSRGGVAAIATGGE